MAEDFNSSQPIYYQLVQRLCRQIVRGELGPGEKLPSVRELAIQVGVNPNTVQRVYTELERMGVAEMRRGQGTFVTESTNRLKELRAGLMAENITAFVNGMQEMGFNREEIMKGVQEHLNRGTDSE